MQGQTFSFVLCGAWQFPEELAGCFVNLLSWNCSMSSLLWDCRRRTPGGGTIVTQHVTWCTSNGTPQCWLHSAYLTAVDCVGSKPPSPQHHLSPSKGILFCPFHTWYRFGGRQFCSVQRAESASLIWGTSVHSGCLPFITLLPHLFISVWVDSQTLMALF